MLKYMVGLIFATIGLMTGCRTVQSTAYCQNGTMADGKQTYVGAVASNLWPLGTVIHVSDSPYGSRDYVVEDRVGYGSDLDFFVNGCDTARNWGRRLVVVNR